MAWPFTSPIAPSYDSGFTAIPLTSTALTTGDKWIIGMRFCNATASSIAVTVTDTAGGKIFDAFPISAHSAYTAPESYMPVTGIKWFAATSGLTGKVWGY